MMINYRNTITQGAERVQKKNAKDQQLDPGGMAGNGARRTGKSQNFPGVMLKGSIAQRCPISFYYLLNLFKLAEFPICNLNALNSHSIDLAI